MTKTCSTCNEIKPVEAFPKTGAKCKPCKAEYNRRHYEANRDKIAERARRHYEANREKILEQKRRYGEANRDKITEYQRHRREANPWARVRDSMSLRIRQMLNGAKSKRTAEIVGYDGKKLWRHLARQFEPGMTKDNYGTAWHIDHIIPVSAFNITSEDDLDMRRCWALKNLRPMWAKDNMSKGATLEAPFQPSLALALPEAAG